MCTCTIDRLTTNETQKDKIIASLERLLSAADHQNTLANTLLHATILHSDNNQPHQPPVHQLDNEYDVSRHVPVHSSQPLQPSPQPQPQSQPQSQEQQQSRQQMQEQQQQQQQLPQQHQTQPPPPLMLTQNLVSEQHPSSPTIITDQIPGDHAVTSCYHTPANLPIPVHPSLAVTSIKTSSSSSIKSSPVSVYSSSNDGFTHLQDQDQRMENLGSDTDAHKISDHGKTSDNSKGVDKGLDRDKGLDNGKSSNQGKGLDRDGKSVGVSPMVAAAIAASYADLYRRAAPRSMTNSGNNSGNNSGTKSGGHGHGHDQGSNSSISASMCTNNYSPTAGIAILTGPDSDAKRQRPSPGPLALMAMAVQEKRTEVEIKGVLSTTAAVAAHTPTSRFPLRVPLKLSSIAQSPPAKAAKAATPATPSLSIQSSSSAASSSSSSSSSSSPSSSLSSAANTTTPLSTSTTTPLDAHGLRQPPNTQHHTDPTPTADSVALPVAVPVSLTVIPPARLPTMKTTMVMSTAGGPRLPPRPLTTTINTTTANSLSHRSVVAVNMDAAATASAATAATTDDDGEGDEGDEGDACVDDDAITVKQEAMLPPLPPPPQTNDVIVVPSTTTTTATTTNDDDSSSLHHTESNPLSNISGTSGVSNNSGTSGVSNNSGTSGVTSSGTSGVTMTYVASTGDKGN